MFNTTSRRKSGYSKVDETLVSKDVEQLDVDANVDKHRVPIKKSDSPPVSVSYARNSDEMDTRKHRNK